MPFPGRILPLCSDLVLFICLLMWDVGRSTIALPWNGGSVPPIQWGHSSLSFSSSSVLLFSNLTPCVTCHRDIPCAPPWGLRRFVLPRRARFFVVHINTTILPIYEDQPQSGSLFASHILPPLRPHPHPLPQPYPLLRPPEWSSSSYQRADEGCLRCLVPREIIDLYGMVFVTLCTTRLIEQGSLNAKP